MAADCLQCVRSICFPNLKKKEESQQDGGVGKSPAELDESYVVINVMPKQNSQKPSTLVPLQDEEQEPSRKTPSPLIPTIIETRSTVGHKRYERRTRSASPVHPVYFPRASPEVCELPRLAQCSLSPKAVRLFSTIHFSLYYDYQASTLSVELLKATNLGMVRKGRRSDPPGVFVAVHLHPSKDEVFKSNVALDMTDPVFDQVFEFSNLSADDISKQSLIFRIYEDAGSSKGKFIGSVVVTLCEVDLFGSMLTTVIDETGKNLPHDSKADLLLSLMFCTDKQLLLGTVMKMTSLQEQLTTATCDLFVKLHLVYNGIKQAEWKTSVKKNTLKPVFNESFQFDISKKNLSHITLRILVKSYDRFSPNILVGEASVGERVPSESGRSHWADVFTSPDTAVSHWHSIRMPVEPQQKRGHFRRHSAQPDPSVFYDS